MSGQKGGQEDGPKDRQEGRLKDGSKGGSKDGQRASPKDGPEDGQRDRLKSGQRAGQKDRLLLLGWAASISLIAVAVSLLLVSNHYSRYQFDLLSGVCRGVVEREPEARAVVAAALKEAMGGGPGSGPSGGPGGGAGEDVLSALGYRREDLAGPVHGTVLLSALTEYLEQVETGKAAILSATGEDGFSKLEDGIYKTVTSLYQTRDAAVQARNALAENLANIAHQIKTPITAISLSVQRMEQDAADHPQIEHLRNHLKINCMEHDPGGRVHCSYAQELLYTEILIWDEGKGFAKEDLPHLFERFYRGKDAGEGGIGIGLALSKELIERQNGTIWAQNRPGGGALFAIRFYSH